MWSSITILSSDHISNYITSYIERTSTRGVCPLLTIFRDYHFLLSLWPAGLVKLQSSLEYLMFAVFVIREYHWVVFPNFTLLSLFAQSGVTDNQSWENGRAWPLWSHRSPTARAYKSWAYQSNIIVSIVPSVCYGINLQSLATAHLNSAFNPMVFATYLVIRENSTLF